MFILDDKIISMQQLYHIAKQRYSSLLIANQPDNNQTSDKYRQLREEQKQRCEKQSWILSMLRSKKRQVTPELKKTIYNYSYDIMRVVDPTFTANYNPIQGALENNKNQELQNEENFLNSLVCLYTKFFDQFETKLSFKVKIRSFLRPTNHNVINDLVKYLVDFSRDYCQYLLYLRMKNMQREDRTKLKHKPQKQIQNESEQKYQVRNLSGGKSSFSSSNGNITMVNSTKLLKQQIRVPQLKKSPISSLSSHIVNTAPEEQNSESSLISRKKEFDRIYGVLDIQNLSNFVLMEKNRSNIDVVKLKMNQMYRDIKFRNNMVRASLNQYYNQYYPNKNSHVSKQQIVEDQSQLAYPFKVTLIIQKNGFSCLNLGIANQKSDRNLSPLKDQKNRSSSLSIRQGANISNNFRNTSKNDFVLNSLKVIRVSENTLPPIQQNTVGEYKSSTKLLNKYSNFPMLLDNYDSKKQKIERANTSTLIENQLKLKLGLVEKVQEKKNGRPPQQILQSDNQKVRYGPIYYSYNYSYNQETIREAERKKIQKKRISDIRRHFTSEQKMKNSKKKLNDPQQKLVEWLDKINLMKQLQKKKIMGLS